MHAFACSDRVGCPNLNEKQTLLKQCTSNNKRFVIHLDIPKIQFLKCSWSSFEIVINAHIILKKFVLEPHNITQQGGSSLLS